mmetsp:Transcript_5721/g.14940  ORF Transcript_5721/g.14940 Transcript_5721/m.14940 type:complete len:108 (-) Transcript_5721:240-563(-)
MEGLFGEASEYLEVFFSQSTSHVKGDDRGNLHPFVRVGSHLLTFCFKVLENPTSLLQWPSARQLNPTQKISRDRGAEVGIGLQSYTQKKHGAMLSQHLLLLEKLPHV